MGTRSKETRHAPRNPTDTHVTTIGMPVAPRDIKSQHDNLAPTHTMPARTTVVLHNFNPGIKCRVSKRSALVINMPAQMATATPLTGEAVLATTATPCACNMANPRKCAPQKEAPATTAAAAPPGRREDAGAADELEDGALVAVGRTSTRGRDH